MGEGVMHVITPFVWGFYNLFDGGITLPKKLYNKRDF